MAEHSILVVEDDSTVRELLRYRLGKHYDVRTASDGEAALEAVDRQMPDLIISDIMMPKMDGFDLQSALQSDKNTRVIPFIFLTARADEPSRREGTRMGVDDYITKPFDMDQLLSRVERLLERVDVFQSNLDAEIGRDFSNRLMPKRVPDVEGYRLDFHSYASRQGGGDLLDWTETTEWTDGDAPSYFFTVGDVMGKGVRAKFYAYSFLSYVRGTLNTLLQESTSPARLMERVNGMLFNDEVLEDTFASLLLFHWEPAAHRLVLTNAGHCRPVLVDSDGTPSVIEPSDLILGLEPEVSFNEHVIDLPDGGAFVVYTDGLMEERNADGEMIGEEGVQALAADALGTTAPIDHLRASALDRAGAEEFSDDTLILWMERTD